MKELVVYYTDDYVSSNVISQTQHFIREVFGLIVDTNICTQRLTELNLV